MSNISTDNSTYTSGGIDTRTTLDGTFDATFQQMNGAASGVVAVETILGDGPTLKGSVADLVARLAVLLNADGTLKGTGFSGLTTDYGLLATSATEMVVRNHTPIASIIAYAGGSPPTHWLLCNGASVSRTTYAKLLTAIGGESSITATMTIASPCVVTATAHGLAVGQPIAFTTTGALPTGLTANTQYYVAGTVTADTYNVSATIGGANINTSGTQSGVHTHKHIRYGVGDNSTTFSTPDLQGRAIIMVDGASNRVTSASTNGTYADTIGGVGGTETHTLTEAELAVHDHNNYYVNGAASGTGQAITGSGGNDVDALNNESGATAGGGNAHSNTQPWMALNYIIFAGV